MKKQNIPCLLLTLMALCALAALGTWWGFNEITSRAEAIFGPSAPNLGLSQKFLLSWQLLQREDQLTAPVNPFGEETSFQIEFGESPAAVAQRLAEADLIQEASVFRDFLIYTGLDRQLQAGNYTLSPATNAIEIANLLLDATPAEVPFAVLAGWRIEEIAEALPTSGLNITPEAFLAEARNRNLEGYLLPGVYSVPRAVSAQELLDRMQAAFDGAVTPEMRAGFSTQGLSVDQAVRLASIIEREAVVDNESTLIASVFINRLAVGMKLEADPTVQYALGYSDSQRTWWTNPLSSANLSYDSPYNTYVYAGLPPGPICNPGLESLRAVAFPAQTPYYYFRAACDGSREHNFAETFDEHVANACP